MEKMRSVKLCYRKLIKELNLNSEYFMGQRTDDFLNSFHILSMMTSLLFLSTHYTERGN